MVDAQSRRVPWGITYGCKIILRSYFLGQDPILCTRYDLLLYAFKSLAPL